LYGPKIGALLLSHMPQQMSDLWFRRYNIPSFLSIPEKTELAKAPLLPPPASITQPVLSITYCSGASFPFATPPVIATGFGWPSIGLGTEGVNSRIARFLLTALKENTTLRGWTLMDFYDKPVGSGIVPLLIEYNFRGSARDAPSAIVSNPTAGPNGTSILHSP
jgi:1-phosphatidylinositol phosphodiesterase